MYYYLMDASLEPRKTHFNFFYQALQLRVIVIKFFAK